MKLFTYYILIINLYGFIVMYIDKNKSKKGKWRIPEKKLFLISLFLGSLGILLGMYMFRHKTKHIQFVVGIPLILCVQSFAMLYLYLKQ